MPTVFQPRGSCISDYPRTGEFTMAIWGAPGTKGTYKYLLGLGRKETDTMKMSTTILNDYIMMPMYQWNYWNPFVVILPILIAFFTTQYFLVKMTQNQEKESPTLFQWLAMSGGSILIGHVIFNIINFIWCLSLTSPGGDVAIALCLAIFLPGINGVACFMVGHRGCCCKQNLRCKNICGRVTLALVGMIHMFGWHAGYLFGPISLITAAFLPTKMADYKFGGPKKIPDANQVSTSEMGKMEVQKDEESVEKPAE